MKEALLDIRAGIKAGRYVNEATVSQGIVQRLLHSLGWPVYDTEIVPVGYELYGQQRRARNARDVLIQVFREFAERDPSFLERFAALPKHGRKRRYLARTREDLYPGSPHLVDNAYEVRPGWWIDTNVDRLGIEKRIKMGCEVAGVRYAKDLTVNLG